MILLSRFKPSRVADYLHMWMLEQSGQRIMGDRKFARAAEMAADLLAEIPLLNSIDGVVVEPPVVTLSVQSSRAPYFVAHKPVLIRDYLDREARNASLGRAGEEFVVEFEQRRLHGLGKKTLANKVEHVAATKGDGLGFDVRSFDEAGSERFIEVKTTAWGKETPFFISRNELEFSKAYPGQFHLYRVFGFRKSPHLFDLPGVVDRNCLLDPVTYVGRFS